MSDGEATTLSYGRPPQRDGAGQLVRIAKYVALVVVGLILVLVVASYAYAWYLPRQARSEAIAALSNVNTLEECKPILKLGTWLQMKDGSWIAIRYDDCHAPFWSMSVAIDSGGNWYESDEHFCGQFMGYESRKETVAEEIAILRKDNKPIPSELEDGVKSDPLHDIEQSPDLKAAIPKLLKMGFRPRPKP